MPDRLSAPFLKEILNAREYRVRECRFRLCNDALHEHASGLDSADQIDALARKYGAGVEVAGFDRGWGRRFCLLNLQALQPPFERVA